MGVSTVLRLLLLFMSGVGFAELADKVFPGKVKNYEPVSPGFKPRKLAFFLGAMTVGGLVWNFVNRKFHIITRRHSAKRRRRSGRRRR